MRTINWFGDVGPTSLVRHAYAILYQTTRWPKVRLTCFRNIAFFTSLDNVDAPSLAFLPSVIHYHCPDI